MFHGGCEVIKFHACLKKKFSILPHCGKSEQDIFLLLFRSVRKVSNNVRRSPFINKYWASAYLHTTAQGNYKIFYSSRLTSSQNYQRWTELYCNRLKKITLYDTLLDLFSFPVMFRALKHKSCTITSLSSNRWQ